MFRILNDFYDTNNNVTVLKASPLDVRVMYGKTWRDMYSVGDVFDKQLEQIYAAMKLSENLESIDMIDLASTAIVFYNKLVMNSYTPENKIKLEWIGKDYSEQQRRWVVDTNWYNLNTYYDEPRYKNPLIIPSTIEELLIKIQWMAFMQLPDMDVENLEAKVVLTWNTFDLWLHSVYEHLDGWYAT